MTGTETSGKPSGLNEFAALVELTPRQVQNLARDGFIKKPYTVETVVRGYIASLKDQMKRQTQKHADTRTGEARAQKIEFELATAQKKFIGTEVAMAMIDEVFGPLRADLEGLPASYSRDMEQRSKLDGLIGTILNSAADRAAEAGRALRAGGDDPSPQAAAMARRLGAEQQAIPGNRGRPRTARSRPDPIRHSD
jgi:hypothetical protein